MGAEPWEVRAKWQADIAEVLKATRERVFREGSYAEIPGREFTSLAGLDAFFMEEPEADEEGRVDDSGFGGTSSILDVRGVSEVLEPGSTAPLSPSVTETLFGTRTPGADDLTDARRLEIYEQMNRGDSLYVVLHEAGRPVEVVFFGYSWD